MKYKYIVGYCPDCRKVTKWRKECPKGTWHCMNCNGKAESEGEVICSDKRTEVENAYDRGFDDGLEEGIRDTEPVILDKIRAEIEQAADKQFQIAMGVADLNERYSHIQMENAYRHSLNIIDKYIIDKYKSEVEPQEREE